MTADPDARPVSLRSHLRDLQATRDEAGRLLREHLTEHACRGTCTEGRRLAGLLADHDYQIQLTRFLNEDTDP